MDCCEGVHDGSREFMEYSPKDGEIVVKEKSSCHLTLEAKTLIWASVTLTLLVITNVYTSIAFNKDISMIIIPLTENTWMIIGYGLLIYGFIRQRFEPLSFLLVAILPSLLLRFIGILMCIMIAVFPDSYTRKLNRLGDDVAEEKVRVTAIILVSISLALEVLEIVTAIYTLICRYHLKEVCAQRRRREAAFRRPQQRSARPSQSLDEQSPLKQLDHTNTSPQQTSGGSVALSLKTSPDQK
uniref:Uncharacterized protein n=1 Tax=Ascaris lumbricoides TaxID=6252 RepID=A0A9J2PWP9_ASCLU